MKDKLTLILYNIKSTITQFGWLLIIIFPLFIFVNWAVFSIATAQKETISTRLYIAANSEINTIDLYLNSRLGAIHDDIHVIIDADETDQYLQNPTPTTITNYQNLIYRIAGNKLEFVNMMMVDPSGDIIYHINHEDPNHLFIASGDLGDIKNDDYFNAITQMDPTKLFISKMYIKHDKPIMTIVKPMMNEDIMVSYLVVDYDVNDFLSVFNLYTTNEDNYFDFGLMNDEIIWRIDDANSSIHMNTDAAYRTQLLDRIIYNNDIVTYHFLWDDQSDHFYTEASNDLRFYVLLDMDTAIAESESILLKNTALIAILLNFMTGALITYLAYMIRTRKDDRLLINANMYLSVQNQDSIIIINRGLRVIYVNPAFEKRFGYTAAEVYLKKALQVIQLPNLPLVLNPQKRMDDEEHIWSRNKQGFYFMTWMRLKEESSFAGRDKNYICIQSDANINLDKYQDDDIHKKTTIDEIERLFNLYPFDLVRSTMFLIAFEHADTIDFAAYLKRHLNRTYVIAIPKEKHIMIYAKIETIDVQKEITHIDRLIESYRSKGKIDRDFTHKLVIAKASETVRDIRLLIEASLAGLIYHKAHLDLKYLIYSDHIKTTIELEKRIENELDNAFVRQEFYMEYQIIKDLNHDKYLGVEALLRWHNNALGQVSPQDFIPVIEKSNYISKLTAMVLSIIMYDFEPLIDELDDDFRISINLSSYDLNNMQIIDQMIFSINQSNLSPHHLMFEITENAYNNNIEEINRFIDKLHDQGILLAVDDFGTGYKSINLLKQIKADFVKIDRSYLSHYPDDDDGVMLDTLVHLVQRFNVPLIAEGVETNTHIQYCKTNHIHYAQGYHIARPIKIDLLKDIIIK